MTRDELKSILNEVFEERSRVDNSTHCEHHEWLQAHIEREKARNKLIWEAAKVVTGWSVLAIAGALTGILQQVWSLVRHIFGASS